MLMSANDVFGLLADERVVLNTEKCPVQIHSKLMLRGFINIIMSLDTRLVSKMLWTVLQIGTAACRYLPMQSFPYRKHLRTESLRIFSFASVS